jgi:hypothetical protein
LLFEIHGKLLNAYVYDLGPIFEQILHSFIHLSSPFQKEGSEPGGTGIAVAHNNPRVLENAALPDSILGVGFGAADGSYKG